MFQVVTYCVVYLACWIACSRGDSQRVRQFVLLVGSYAVYFTWGKWFALVLLASTAINFLVGKRLLRAPSAAMLSLGIVLNVLLLGCFKYLPEAAATMPFASLQGFSHLVMPLGISFWTFQAMSYLFDQYRGEELDPSFTEFALYMSFFPVLISGPICRMPEMLPQFRSEERSTFSDLSEGLRRVGIGVFMIQVSRLLGSGAFGGDGVTSGFDKIDHWGGLDVWLLAFGFGLQLFFNFAGYTHIVIGAARGLGFTLPENFDRPFFSSNPAVFWTRWHISLSFWIRDYLFLPLAMLRRDLWWRNFVVFSSMVVFGVWHRGTLLFVMWGAYHGILLVAHRMTQLLQKKLRLEFSAPIWTPLGWAVTASMVSLGWIFFRANSVPHAMQMLAAVVTPDAYRLRVLSNSFGWLVIGIAIAYVCVVMVADLLREDASAAETARFSGMRSALVRLRWYWVLPLYVIASIVLVVVGMGAENNAAQLMYSGF